MNEIHCEGCQSEECLGLIDSAERTKKAAAQRDALASAARKLFKVLPEVAMLAPELRIALSNLEPQAGT